MSVKKKEMPPVMILCGGKGTRLRDVTELLPKPMVSVGNHPILWHIMRSYSAFGVKRFILCLGYKKEIFIDYFLNFSARENDVTIKLGQVPELKFHGKKEEEDWEVTLADTGLESCTATRIRIASKYLKSSDKKFFLTYGDGVSDVNITKLLENHNDSGCALTISAVHPEGRFGEIHFRKDNTIRFTEKPIRTGGFVNGGFMVVEKSVIRKYIPMDQDVYFESEPFSRITADCQMNAYRHEGFWQCMDTPREHDLLNRLWDSGEAPWTTHWKDRT